MHECTSDVNNYFFKSLILGVWKNAQMQQNTFLPLQRLKIIFFKNLILVVWKYPQMHKNTF